MPVGQSSPFYNHIKPFATQTGPEQLTSSSASVARALKNFGETSPNLIGFAVHHANSLHAGTPTIVCYKEDGFGRYFHLGTTRIWNIDGSINEARWNFFETYVRNGDTTTPLNQLRLKHSVLKQYLDLRLAGDDQELHTGRNNQGCCRSVFFQKTLTDGGWSELFKLMACGWVPIEGKKTYESYITMDRIRAFFEDTGKAFEQAKQDGLPVSMPDREPISDDKEKPPSSVCS